MKMYGRWIDITNTKPDEAHLSMCNYCKSRGHAIFVLCKQTRNDQLYTAQMSTQKNSAGKYRTNYSKHGPEYRKTRNKKKQIKDSGGTSQQKENIQTLSTKCYQIQQLSDSAEKNTDKLPPPNLSFASFSTVGKKKSKRKSVTAKKRKKDNTKKKESCGAKSNKAI